MPRCRNCSALIIFVRPEPNHWQSDPKAIPIDVAPDPQGTIALYEMPPRGSAYPPERDFEGTRATHSRRLGGEAAAAYLRLGGSLYRIHFDTCPARRPQRPERR